MSKLLVMDDTGFMIIVHLPLYKAVSMMCRDVWYGIQNAYLAQRVL
jgi:hypothetical protein